jgi:hypothetical protein
VADEKALKRTLGQLRGVPLERGNPVSAAMAPQEMLDFLAMQAGLKPVYLLGRGLDDSTWISGVESLAKAKGLRVVRGSFWSQPPDHSHLPPEVAALMTPGERKATKDARYICRAPATERELRSIGTTPTIEQEANLLGYPVCCVRDYYARQAAVNRGFALMVRRVGNGDVEEMMRVIREDVGMAPETEEEIDLMARGENPGFAPFTSFQMCSACRDNEGNPARVISREYEMLAEAVDPSLAAEIRRFQV